MATFAINETARREQYVSTGQATYNFNFQVNVADELLVYVNDTAQTLSVQYNATLNANGTGSITFIDNSGGGGTNYTPSSGDLVTIIGDLALSRTTTLNTAADITTANLDTEFDNTVIRQQQIKEITDRALQLKPSTPRTVTGSGTSGPIYFPYNATPSNNASRVISYDSNGTALELGPTTANLNNLAGIISDISTVAGISSDVTTVAGISSNVTTVAGISSNISTVAGISSDVTSVAGNETNINAVNSNSSNINTVAGGITNINTVAGGITNINTVATNISNINTVAGISSNVTTVANNVSDVNNFANVYRIGSSDPSTSLDEGDLFYNSTSNELKYYNGSSWVAIIADTDVKTKVSANDTTAGFLNGKLVAGSNVTLTENNDGGDETLTIAATDNSIPFAIALG